jgi:hypothetical protein
VRHVHAGQTVIDLVRLPNRSAMGGEVQGLCW